MLFRSIAELYLLLLFLLFIYVILHWPAGAVKYGDTIMLVGGEDDKSWMAGMYTLSNDEGTQSWVAGQELPMVMSTFGCVIANIRKDLFAVSDWQKLSYIVNYTQCCVRVPPRPQKSLKMIVALESQ